MLRNLTLILGCERHYYINHEGLDRLRHQWLLAPLCMARGASRLRDQPVCQVLGRHIGQQEWNPNRNNAVVHGESHTQPETDKRSLRFFSSTFSTDLTTHWPEVIAFFTSPVSPLIKYRWFHPLRSLIQIHSLVDSIRWRNVFCE